MDQHITSVPSVASPSDAPSYILFQSNRREFFRLLRRGAALELITVGFYRFWLATDIRRHLWRNTSVDGDALEYTGLAKELLIGALLALAIFVPIYFAYFLISIEAERVRAFASIPFGLFFYLFTQFAVYRARRYRLTRTIWRGVRFWMTGSGWNYAWRAGLWGLLVILTLGVALPWREAALERFKMRHSFYGDLQGRFTGTGGQFFKNGWWLWLLTGLALIVSALVPLAIMIAGPFLYAAFRAVQWRWWISGIRFGEVQFESNLPRGAFIGLYWKVIGWGMLLFFGLFVFAVIAGSAVAMILHIGGAMTQQDIAALAQQPLVFVAIGVGYVLAALMLGVVMRLYLVRDLVQRVALSTTVHNIAAAQNVSAQGRAVSALGEGFADSLDIWGF